MPATLTKAEIHAYLDSKPGWIILTTIGRDGMPHTIPIGYFLERSANPAAPAEGRSGDEIYIGATSAPVDPTGGASDGGSVGGPSVGDVASADVPPMPVRRE